MRNYVYFGKLQRNISYRGCSFPVSPGYVIRCHPGFLEHFLPPKEFKEAASSVKPKYTFPNTKTAFATDPSGGLPMTSTEDPGPNFIKDRLPSPATVADKEYDELYDMRAEAQKREEDRTKLEESTNPTVKTEKAKDEVKTEDKVPAPAAAPGPDEDLPPAKKPGKKTKKKKAKAEPVKSGPAYDQPTKTAIRQLRKAELIKTAEMVAKAGAPRHPELLETLSSFDEDTHKAPIFDALWNYYDMDELE